MIDIENHKKTKRTLTSKNNKEYNYLDDILDANFLKNYFK